MGKPARFRSRLSSVMLPEAKPKAQRGLSEAKKFLSTNLKAPGPKITSVSKRIQNRDGRNSKFLPLFYDGLLEI